MFRTKTLLILALMLFTLVTPVVAVYAEDEVTPVGTAKIQDDKSTNDSVVVSLSGIAPAPEGSDYKLSLESYDGKMSLTLGTLDVVLPVIHGVTQTTGTVSFTFDSSSEAYDGSNLLATFNRIMVTEEPSGTYVYGDSISNDAAKAIRSAIDSVADMNTALDAAVTAAKAAQAATLMDDINANLNTAVTSIDAIAGISTSINEQAAAATAADGDDAEIAGGATSLEAITANIATWTNAAKAVAETNVAGTTNVTVAQIFVGKIVNDLEAARNGWDADNDGTISGTSGEGGGQQAYKAAQGMADLSLSITELPAIYVAPTPVPPAPTPTPKPAPTPVPTPEPEEEVIEKQHVLDIGLPSVGEELLAQFMLISLVGGLGLAGIGGLLYARNRR